MDSTAQPNETVTFQFVDSDEYVMSFKMYKDDPIQKAIKIYVERTNKQMR